MSSNKDKTLPEALGITSSRSTKIIREVKDLLVEIGEKSGKHLKVDNSKYLLALYEKYDDKELLFAVYAGSRLIEMLTG